MFNFAQSDHSLLLPCGVGDPPVMLRQSVWQTLVERNERMKLLQESIRNSEDAMNKSKETEALRLRLEEQERRAAEAEDNARWVGRLSPEKVRAVSVLAYRCGTSGWSGGWDAC